jgi:predicted ATPase
MITGLDIDNFKAFEKQPLGFGKLTLLAGLNGMGKSSAIQVLLLLRQSQEQRLLETAGLALLGDLVNIGTARDALCEGAKEDRICFRLSTDSGTREWKFRYDVPEANVMPLASVSGDVSCLQDSLFTDNFQYLTAERVGPRVAFAMSDFAVRQHHNVGSRGEFAAHMLAYTGDLDVRNEGLMHPLAKSRRVREQVEAWLGDISPGTRIHLDPHSELDLIGVQYSFAGVQTVTNRYRATNVGFGLSYVFPVIVAALAAKRGDLLIIENPEAHIHPRGQMRLGRLLSLAAAAGVQVVIETHSDHVLNGIRLAVHQKMISHEWVTLHYFERAKAEGPVRASVSTPSIDENGRIAHWPEGFFDEWDRALEQLMLPAK